MVGGGRNEGVEFGVSAGITLGTLTSFASGKLVKIFALPSYFLCNIAAGFLGFLPFPNPRAEFWQFSLRNPVILLDCWLM